MAVTTGRELDAKLVRFVADWINKPFLWGRTDCNILVLDWLEQLTGKPATAAALGLYTSEREARAYVREYPQTLLEVLADCGAVELEHRRLYRAGDVLVVKRAGEPWYRGHVCLGTRYLATDEEHGPRVPLMDQLGDDFSTWRVVS